MSGIDLATAQARLDDWLAADAAVSSGQSYTHHNRSLTRADASEIRENIAYWNNWVIKLSRTGGRASRVKGAVPI